MCRWNSHRTISLTRPVKMIFILVAKQRPTRVRPVVFITAVCSSRSPPRLGDRTGYSGMNSVSDFILKCNEPKQKPARSRPIRESESARWLRRIMEICSSVTDRHPQGNLRWRGVIWSNPDVGMDFVFCQKRLQTTDWLCFWVCVHAVVFLFLSTFFLI